MKKPLKMAQECRAELDLVLFVNPLFSHDESTFDQHMKLLTTRVIATRSAKYSLSILTLILHTPRVYSRAGSDRILSVKREVRERIH